MLFILPPAGAASIPSVITLQAGSAADLQTLVDQTLQALAVSRPTDYLLGYTLGSAGNGSQFSISLTVGLVGALFSAVSLAGSPSAVPTYLILSRFAAAATRSRIVVGGSGTAAEATAALEAQVATIITPGNPLLAQWDLQVVGSSNAQQWAAAALLSRTA